MYLIVEQLIEMVDEPNQSACKQILADNHKLFRTVPGATHNHQTWTGGYFDHVQEVMNIAVVLYGTLDILRPLPFTLSDAILVLFLHDIEKPWKYEVGVDGELQHIPELRSKAAQHEFRTKKLEEYGIILTPEQQNGMKYVEGELDDYTNRRRVMGTLAAFCHLCDVSSARIWFDHPSEKDDLWEGAKRLKK